jgi:hypothetical protein
MSFGDMFGFRCDAIPSVKNELGLNPNHPEILAFERMHSLFGLPKEALGVSFVVGGDIFRLMGLAAGRSRYPLVVEKNDKRMFLVDDPRVIAAINRRKGD